MPNVPPEMVRQLGQYCDVRSKTFKVRHNGDIDGYSRTFHAILGRNNPRDVQMLSFYWSDPSDQKR